MAEPQGRDFAASRRFYAEILGLPVIEEWDAPEGRGCVFGSILSLGRGRSNASW